MHPQEIPHFADSLQKQFYKLEKTAFASYTLDYLAS